MCVCVGGGGGPSKNLKALDLTVLTFPSRTNNKNVGCFFMALEKLEMRKYEVNLVKTL